MTTISLHEAREKIAQELYESFDFERSISDQCGWETTVPGDIFTRTVFGEGLDDSDCSETLKFVVIFHPGSTAVYEVTAYNSIFQTIGKSAFLPDHMVAVARPLRDAYVFDRPIIDRSAWLRAGSGQAIAPVVLAGNRPNEEIFVTLRMTFDESTNIISAIAAYNDDMQPVGSLLRTANGD